MLSALLLAAELVFSASHAQTAYRYARDFVSSCPEREAGRGTGREAAFWILDHASIAGLDVHQDIFDAATPHGPRRMVNLWCAFEQDEKLPWVILLSHYDTKPGSDCPGANDGASTTALLMALGESLDAVYRTRAPRRANVMLVWTDGEECQYSYAAGDGFWGSRRAATRLRDSGRKVAAAICLDMLGDQDLAITLPANGDERLKRLAARAGKAAGVSVSRIHENVKDDHMPFIEAGYPALDLIDFTYPPWHTPEDTIDHISEKSLLESGKLVAQIVGFLI